MTADKTYLAVPTLTGFTIVRGDLKERRDYTAPNGQPMPRIETGAQRIDAAVTVFQPVYGIVDGKPAVVRYLDLGTDEHSFPKEVPTQQEEAQGPKIVGMDTVIDADTLDGFKNILAEILSADIPDFAAQPSALNAIGVTRYFNIDRIQFAGRFDRPKEAFLELLIGVYADVECKELRMVMSQKFVSDSVLDERKGLIDSWKATLAGHFTESGLSSTTVERKAELAGYIKTLSNQIDRATEELSGLQSLAKVVTKPAIKDAMKEITESIFTQYRVVKPAYSKISVESLMALFDSSFGQLVSLIAPAPAPAPQPEPEAE